MLTLFLSVSSSMDMSATFAKLRTCGDCVDAGYGWCPLRRRCGGFANKECGVGPQYVAEAEASRPTTASKPKQQPSPKQKASGSATAGTDMRSTFAKLRTCTACVNAGYGWCPLQRKCGGFANKECGVGPSASASASTPAASRTDSEPPRNGLWQSKKQQQQTKQAAAPPTAEVPSAAPSPPDSAAMLYAGPLQRAQVDSATAVATATTITTKAAATATTSNESTSAPHLSSPLDEEALMRLPHASLVSLVLKHHESIRALSATIDAMQQRPL